MVRLLLWIAAIMAIWAFVWSVTLAVFYDHRPAGATPDRPPASAEVDHGDEQA